jgi:AICAR transformylase/IMP cyclohydrolase PurH|tara:strand:- start:17355 stop:17702 length:348 start_codon:yes stop_codon:yes gene_type:complete
MGLRLQERKNKGNKELDSPKMIKDDESTIEMVNRKQVKDIVSAGYTRAEAVEMLKKKSDVDLKKLLKRIDMQIREKDIQEGKEVNKGGLIKKTAKKMMGGGKVYSRGSRKAKYSG